MGEVRPYHVLCKDVHYASLPCSSRYLEGGDVGLREDLLNGYIATFSEGGDYRRLSFDTADDLIRELDTPGERRAIVVRTADRLFTTRDTEQILLRLERVRRSHDVLILFVGGEIEGPAREWFEANNSYGRITEPTFEKLGHWMAAKTSTRWDYQRVPADALITPEVGLRLLEHVGWRYTAALQAAMSLRMFRGADLRWPVVAALIAPEPGFGYSESLVFGKGRRGALTLAEGIPDAERLKTLGLIRFYLRQFSKLRAIEVDSMSDRAVEAESGIHIWHWRSRYKPVYATYTNDRIRLRLEATERAMMAVRSGAKHGVLELLVAEW